MRLICVAAALAAATGVAMPAYAAGEWPEGPNTPWFEQLQRPDNHLAPYRNIDPKSLFCCGIADTVKTKFKVEGDGRQSKFVSPNCSSADHGCWNVESAFRPWRAFARDADRGGCRGWI